MRSLTLLLACTLLSLPAAVAAQDVSSGCGTTQKAVDVIEIFSPRFVSADSEYVNYRAQNGLQALDAGEPIEAMTDPVLCAGLRARVDMLLREKGWVYWSTSPWETTYVRLGPYYLAYVEKKLPAGMVGGGWRIYLFDVATHARIPTSYECAC